MSILISAVVMGIVLELLINIVSRVCTKVENRVY